MTNKLDRYGLHTAHSGLGYPALYTTILIRVLGLDLLCNWWTTKIAFGFASGTCTNVILTGTLWLFIKALSATVAIHCSAGHSLSFSFFTLLFAHYLQSVWLGHVKNVLLLHFQPFHFHYCWTGTPPESRLIFKRCSCMRANDVTDIRWPAVEYEAERVDFFYVLCRFVSWCCRLSALRWPHLAVILPAILSVMNKTWSETYDRTLLWTKPSCMLFNAARTGMLVLVLAPRSWRQRVSRFFPTRFQVGRFLIDGHRSHLLGLDWMVFRDCSC